MYSIFYKASRVLLNVNHIMWLIHLKPFSRALWLTNKTQNFLGHRKRTLLIAPCLTLSSHFLAIPFHEACQTRWLIVISCVHALHLHFLLPEMPFAPLPIYKTCTHPLRHSANIFPLWSLPSSPRQRSSFLATMGCISMIVLITSIELVSNFPLLPACELAVAVLTLTCLCISNVSKGCM